MRYLWLAVAATATGFGIWATHFIAMLAYAPGVASAYNIALTILSLVAAIVLTGVGLTIGTARNLPDARALGGAIVGGGIAAMHYTGMAAFEIAGYVRWDTTLVAISIAAGAVLGSLALVVGLWRQPLRYPLAGALLLTLGIGSHHFIAMGAAQIIPDASIVIPRLGDPDRIPGDRRRRGKFHDHRADLPRALASIFASGVAASSRRIACAVSPTLRSKAPRLPRRQDRHRQQQPRLALRQRGRILHRPRRR